MKLTLTPKTTFKKLTHELVSKTVLKKLIIIYEPMNPMNHAKSDGS